MPPVFSLSNPLRRLLPAVLTLVIGGLAARAGEVRLRDGRVFEGVPRFNDSGALVVADTTVDWPQVARASFASGLFFSSGSTPAEGWSALDLGDARGSARLDTNTFSLRVEGRSTNALAGHFVARPMVSDGDLYARVDELAGEFARAGIMLRAAHTAPFAALTLRSDGGIEFQFRPDKDWREVRYIHGPRVTAPVWLRLKLHEKSISAFFATDGKTWQALAKEPFQLGPERTWREAEGDMQVLRASAGVFIASRAPGRVATARVTPLIFMQHGLVGEYFAGREFTNLKMARLDPQIRFDWKSGPPDPALPATNFSVRWTGKIFSKTSASYTFHVDAPVRARLWVDNKETPLLPFYHSWDEKNPPHCTPLMGGLNVEFKLEYEQDASAPNLKLGWAPARQSPEIIGQTNFFHHFAGAKSPESIAIARSTNTGPLVRGVVLRNGTFLAGLVTRADESSVRLAFAGRPEAPVLNNRVARIILRPPRAPLPYEIARGRGGVFLKNGDFFESEFHSLEGNTLTLSSVLFGLKRFGLGGEESPLVVVLNDVTEESAGHEVRLLDGSAWRARKLRATPAALLVTDSILGEFAIPVAELLEIRALDAEARTTP